MKHATIPQSPDRPIDELLFWWPTITRQTRDGWARQFAISIMAASRRRNWQPSDKQLGVMRRMVSDWFSRRGREEDYNLPLIE